MTRKHFRAIAAAVRGTEGPAGRSWESDLERRVREEIAHDLIPVLKQANPRFDKDKFLEAALPERTNEQ